MLSSEERSGLLFTLVGGALLVVGLLFALGFFSDSAPSGRSDAPVQAASLPALPLGSVRGRVIDSRSGFGLAARTIDVRGVEGISDHWVADPDATAPGAFEVRGLPAAHRCTLMIGGDGYMETTREAEVAAGGRLELGDIALVPRVALIGQVVDASGLGLGPARVELASADAGVASGAAPVGERPSLAHADSDPNGNFRFDQLPPGAYALCATTAAGDASFVATDVDASGGGEQRGLRLELFPTVALRGAFRLPVGSPPLFGVVAQGHRGSVAGDGRFEVTRLRAGAVTLFALVDAGHGVAVEVAAPLEGAEVAIDPANATAIATLSTLADERAGELAWLAAAAGDRADATGAALVVRAIGPAGERLAGARIELRPDAAERADAAPRLRFTSRSGECVVRGLPIATSWTLDARLGELRGSIPLRIDAEATRELVLPLAPVATPAPVEHDAPAAPSEER